MYAALANLCLRRTIHAELTLAHFRARLARLGASNVAPPIADMR
jgi:hypothetical protein